MHNKLFQVIDEYVDNFIYMNNREPRWMPSGEFTEDGKLMWCTNPNHARKIKPVKEND